MKNFEKLGFMPADILLPHSGIDMSRWSAVACDQYTSEPDYWHQAYDYADGYASTLSLFLPEAFIDEGSLAAQTEKINAAMRRYLDEGVFTSFANCFIYVERTLRCGAVRRGLVGMVDLEKYEFAPGNDALIRATEGTVADRLPPRITIRRNAPLEMPHIMLLVDDRANTVFSPLEEKKYDLKMLYDFDLMQDSGHLRGRLVENEAQDSVYDALCKLCDIGAQRELYGEKLVSPMLFAVGDGNHSLAAAKKCWEQIRENLTESERASHPARYALVELVNLHDESLEFEAIHRVVFDCEPQKVLAAIKVYFPNAFEGRGDGQQFIFVSNSGDTVVTIPDPKATLTVGSVQAFLDDYISVKGNRIDYIHGEDVVRELCRDESRCGFILPAMSKSELFSAVINDGVLPRKTFSMGEACDKRFYLECRKLVK